MALKTALKSSFEQHRIGAVIVKGSRILSTGYNQRRPSNILKNPTLHAEAAAILKLLKAGRQHDLVGSTIYVSRITPGGRVALAKPCYNCMALIKSVGINRIYYTTNDNTTESIRVS